MKRKQDLFFLKTDSKLVNLWHWWKRTQRKIFLNKSTLAWWRTPETGSSARNSCSAWAPPAFWLVFLWKQKAEPKQSYRYMYLKKTKNKKHSCVFLFLQAFPHYQRTQSLQGEKWGWRETIWQISHQHAYVWVSKFGTRVGKMSHNASPVMVISRYFLKDDQDKKKM